MLPSPLSEETEEEEEVEKKRRREEEVDVADDGDARRHAAHVQSSGAAECRSAICGDLMLAMSFSFTLYALFTGIGRFPATGEARRRKKSGKNENPCALH